MNTIGLLINLNNMKKILILSTITLLAFAIISCSKDDTEVEEELVFEYLGVWSGTYSGDDEGTWELDVNDSGKFIGTMSSDVLPVNSEFDGTVDDSGRVNAVITNDLGSGSMQGQMKDGQVTGSWNINIQNLGGVLQGSKK